MIWDGKFQKLGQQTTRAEGACRICEKKSRQAALRTWREKKMITSETWLHQVLQSGKNRLHLAVQEVSHQTNTWLA